MKIYRWSFMHIALNGNHMRNVITFLSLLPQAPQFNYIMIYEYMKTKAGNARPPPPRDQKALAKWLWGGETIQLMKLPITMRLGTFCLRNKCGVELRQFTINYQTLLTYLYIVVIKLSFDRFNSLSTSRLKIKCCTREALKRVILILSPKWGGRGSAS